MAITLPSLDLPSKPLINLEVLKEIDEFDMPTFAFHDLDYIPSGYGGILAPYIETGPGTMRAAATLMRLNTPSKINIPSPQQVICDLGCGDGEFLIGLLTHVNAPVRTSLTCVPNPPSPSLGFGIDYNASLIATATLNSISANQTASWLVYDFNLDEDDLFGKMVEKGVTHVFVYLVPKQLDLATVKRLLVRLCEEGVLVCCHKFQPGYLREVGRDEIMSLVVYGDARSD